MIFISSKSKKSQKTQFWPILAKIFFKRKLGFVTFHHLFHPNRMQKIRKNYGGNYENIVLIHQLINQYTSASECPVKTANFEKNLAVK